MLLSCVYVHVIVTVSVIVCIHCWKQPSHHLSSMGEYAVTSVSHILTNLRNSISSLDRGNSSALIIVSNIS